MVREGWKLVETHKEVKDAAMFKFSEEVKGALKWVAERYTLRVIGKAEQHWKHWESENTLEGTGRQYWECWTHGDHSVKTLGILGWEHLEREGGTGFLCGGCLVL